MKFLIDTHVLIWWLSQPRRIPKATREVMSLASNQVMVSAATAWEIAIKQHVGKLEFDAKFLADFDESVRKLGFDPLPINAEHAVIGAGLNAAHQDPFDRLLAGQALVEGAVIVSADSAFATLGIQARWR